MLGKKFDTGCRKRFGNLHAFPTSEILRTKDDREITTEKEAKSKQSNEHVCICFALNHFTSLTNVVFYFYKNCIVMLKHAFART